MFKQIALVFFGLAAACAADNWAVLVAGSSGYSNYRHQADVAHAYHVMIENGISADHIITMMVDDIANNAENPFKGKLFNRPGSNQTDYYAGLKIDYRGKDVIPSNFVSILTGGKSVVTATDGSTSEGKVLQSTKDDHVFVNFVDHGGVNIIGFPETTMHATDLISALKTSHERGLFKQMVFYLEACESGSMFETLPADLPIYAITAANGKESSWGTYCSPHDVVDGKSMQTCLGDLFSVNWMQDTEEFTTQLSNGRQLLGGRPTHAPTTAPPTPPAPPTPLGTETLQTQYDHVKVATNKSHVLQFGGKANLAWAASEKVSEFEGAVAMFLGRRPSGILNNPASIHEKLMSAVDSREIPLYLAYERFKATGSQADDDALTQEVQQWQATEVLEKALVSKVAGEEQVQAMLGAERQGNAKDFVLCHSRVVEAFGSTCGWTDATLKVSKTLYQLCEHTHGFPRSIEQVISTVCV